MMNETKNSKTTSSSFLIYGIAFISTVITSHSRKRNLLIPMPYLYDEVSHTKSGDVTHLSLCKKKSVIKGLLGIQILPSNATLDNRRILSYQPMTGIASVLILARVLIQVVPCFITLKNFSRPRQAE
jgi:hypothetical protein